MAVSAVGRARLPCCAFEQMWCGGRRLLQLVARSCGPPPQLQASFDTAPSPFEKNALCFEFKSIFLNDGIAMRVRAPHGDIVLIMSLIVIVTIGRCAAA